MDTYEIIAEFETKTTISGMTKRPVGAYAMTWCGNTGKTGTLKVVFHVQAHCQACAWARGYDVIAACARQVENGTVTKITEPELLSSYPPDEPNTVSTPQIAMGSTQRIKTSTTRTVTVPSAALPTTSPGFDGSLTWRA